VKEERRVRVDRDFPFVVVVVVVVDMELVDVRDFADVEGSVLRVSSEQ
jgi:hypothetical protein